jgi:hypothetical protein
VNFLEVQRTETRRRGALHLANQAKIVRLQTFRRSAALTHSLYTFLVLKYVVKCSESLPECAS